MNGIAKRYFGSRHRYCVGIEALESRTLLSFVVDPTNSIISATAAASTLQQSQTNPAHAQDTFSYAGSEFEPAYSLTASSNASYEATAQQLTLHSDATQSSSPSGSLWGDDSGADAYAELSFSLTSSASVQINGSLSGAGGGAGSVDFFSEYKASSADTSIVDQTFKLSAGNYTIEVGADGSDQAGPSDSTGKADITVTLGAGAPPQITSTNTATFPLGKRSSFTVKTTGNPTPSIIETAILPDGITFVDNGDGTATLSGTPDATDGAGDYDLIFTASNGVSSSSTQPAANQFFTLVLTGGPVATTPPKFTSKIKAFTYHTGRADTFTVTATGNPVPTFTLQGTLPAGISFQDNQNGTASFFGQPSASSGGVYKLMVVASNNSKHVTRQSITLSVIAPPLTPAELSPKPIVPSKPIISGSKKNHAQIHFQNPQRQSFKGVLPIALYASLTKIYSASTAIALISNSSIKLNLAADQDKNVGINFAAAATLSPGNYYIVAVFNDGTVAVSDNQAQVEGLSTGKKTV